MTLNSQPTDSIRRKAPPWLAVAWPWVFLAIFLCQPLPNAGIAARHQLLPLLPFAVLDAIDPPRELGSPPRGLAYLGERLPLLAIAAVIGLAAWGAGSCLLACLPRLELTAAERCYFAVLIGLGLVSTMTLALGLAGGLTKAWFWTGHVVLIGGGIACHLRRRAFVAARADWTWRELWWVAAALPFLIGMTLGSLTPSTDFDVNEYHLGGPKEWYLAGSIHFLEHDVYTSFPFLTEMLLLDAMVLFGDWYWGGVAGQAALMLFAPLTAWGIWLAGRRWFSATAGGVGALVYLTTPWVFRISIIAYSEGGLVAFVFGATFAALLALQHLRQTKSDSSSPVRFEHEVVPRAAGPFVLLASLCAGGAMACKYTGLVSAVGPWAGALSLVALIRAQRLVRTLPAIELPRAWRLRIGLFVVLTFSTGVAVLAGPWLLKNLVETGNPVYPLAYRIFGGRDLDDALADRWRRGHARPSAGTPLGEIRDLGVKAFDVVAVNDWQSPLIFALAPLALLWPGDRRRVYALWGITVWQFLAWWLFMHHLDRFWLPVLPSAALLAGVGFASVPSVPARRLVAGVVVAGVLFNLGFVSTGLVGYNAGLTKLSAASENASRRTGPEIAWLNQAFASGELPADAKVLCVGEAALFHARFPYLYNTVFDHSLLEEWLGVPGDFPAKDRPLRSTGEIHQELASRGITHIYVNWAEILRYRQPYSYGYTDFVHPQRFAELLTLGVLDPPLQLPPEIGRMRIGDEENDTFRLARSWAPELIASCGESRCLITGQIYPVRPAPP